MSADPSPVVLLEFPAADIALLRLNRPQARNALNDEVRQRLASHFQTLGADPAIRVIVLTGDSRCFAAGADLRDLDEHGDRPVRPPQRALLGSHRALPEAGDRRGQRLRPGRRLRTGDALRPDRRRRVGTVRPAGDQGRGDAGCRRHPAPGTGGGQFQALRLLFTGCLVKAPQALAMGLVSEVVADESTLARALELATEIARLPSGAGADQGGGPGRCRPAAGQCLALERKAFQLLFDSQDQKEGMHAFLEKRPPNYQGNRRCPIFVVSPWSVPVRWAPGSPRSPPRPA